MLPINSGRITINMDFQNISGATLKHLLDFCFANSDTISLSQSKNTGMTKDEAEEASGKYNEYLKQNGIREGLRPTEAEVIEMFKDIAETEEELKQLIQREKDNRAAYEANFKMSDEEVKDYLNRVFDDYELIDREVTCMTPCTSGQPHTIYYFHPEENIRAQFYNMKDLFQAVIINEEFDLLLDDPTFYKEGNILLLICSHEKYATLFLRKEQYDDFRALAIPHRVVK